MDILSKRLRELRNSVGLTQSEVAAGLHVSQSSYSGYECGGNPSLEILVLLAGYYGVSTDYLLGVTQQSVSHSKRGEQVLQRLARIPQLDGVLHPVTPALVTDVIDALIAYVATDMLSGPAPLNTAGSTLRAVYGLLETAAGDDLAELMDAANELAVAGLSAQDSVRAYIERKKTDV